MQLADLDAKASNIKMDGGNLSARIDTNRFDIGTLAKMVPALQKYDASGHVEIHSEVRIANRQPTAHGTISLADVAVSRPDAKKALVNNLNGDIKLDGNAADIGPLKFDVGDGHATATLTASSLQPLKATYNFSVDKFKPERCGAGPARWRILEHRHRGRQHHAIGAAAENSSHDHQGIDR